MRLYFSNMDIEFKIAELVDIISEDVSRLASRSYAEDGSSLYDGIKLTSRDSGVQGRMLEERDARLRDILAFCIMEPSEEEPMAEDGDIPDEPKYVYSLQLNGMKNHVIASLRVLMRKYLTEGVLFDWYERHAIDSSYTREGIEDLETRIVCMVRQGYVKKPLQPFGPAD